MPGSVHILRACGVALLCLRTLTWSQQSAAPDSARLHAAVYLVRGSVSGSNIGSFGPFVREGDTTWRRMSLSNVIACGFGRDRAGSRNQLYLAAGNGVHRSTDGGATWRILTGWQTMEIMTVLPDVLDSSTLYVSTPWGVYRSDDDGRSWSERMEGFRHWFVRHLAFDVRSGSTLFATAEDDLYISRDRAQRWAPMGVGAGNVLAFLQHPARPRILCVGTEDRGIVRSTDDGQTWKPADAPFPASIYAFAASPEGDMLYAAGWETGIWHSSDDGATWQVLPASPDTQALFCLLVDPRNPAMLYAGTDGNGVFVSPDRGATWRCIGLQGGKIKHLMFYP